MKKAITHIVSFILGVAITFTIVYLISDTTAETPTPTPIIVEKEVIKEVPVEVVKEVTKEVEIIRKTDLEEVVANTKNSCVMIYAYKDNVMNQGSGWVYNGYIITANHVIEGCKRFEVYTDDTNNARVATIHYIDPDYDLAVLKAPITLKSLTLGNSDKLIEGEKLVSITSPDGIKNSIDECVYSGRAYFGLNTYLTISESNMLGGSSGGAIFNFNSEVIGMTVEGNKGGTYAIPIKDIKSILEKLK